MNVGLVVFGKTCPTVDLPLTVIDAEAIQAFIAIDWKKIMQFIYPDASNGSKKELLLNTTTE